MEKFLKSITKNARQIFTSETANGPYNHPLEAMIALGEKGHYPLFYKEWIELALASKKRYLPREHKNMVKDIVEQLSKQKTIDRKRIVLSALAENDRLIFVRYFLELIEERMLEKKISFQ